MMRKCNDNPSRTELACAPDVLTDAGDRKWVSVPDCVPDFDAAYEITNGSRVEGMYVPLRDPEGLPAGLLFTDDEDTLDAAAKLRTATTEEAEDAAAEILAAKLTGDGLRGMTDEIRSTHVDLMERNLPGISRSMIVLDHLAEPDRGLMWFGFGVGGLLALLGGIFFMRARKLSAGDAAEVLAWHQAHAAQRAGYAAPTFGAPPQGYPYPPAQGQWGGGPGQYPPGQYPPGQYPPQ